MRIVIISTAYPLRGGIAHYVALLYKHLSLRHKVSVVTFKRQYPRFLFPGKSQEEAGEDAYKVPAVQIIDTLNPLTWFKAGRVAARFQPDLVIFKYWMPFFAPAFGVAARVAKRRTGCKVLLICDNVLPHEKTPVDKVLTRWFFKIADYFIVQSKAVERDLLALANHPKYRFVPHPVYEIFGKPIDRDEARRQLGIAENEKIALFFGYIRKYKGLNVLLDATRKALEKIRYKLLVVGEFYDDETAYRNQIGSLKLNEEVIVVGDYVPNEKVAVYFSAADVVILPYINATQSGIAQIAYNFDRPVITTDVGGLAEIVLDGVTGLVVKPASADDLANGIVRFFREDLGSRFSAGVREQKKKFSWDNLVGAIEDLAERSN